MCDPQTRKQIFRQETQQNRHAHIHTHTHTHTHTQRHACAHTESQAHRVTHTHTHIHTESHSHTQLCGHGGYTLVTNTTGTSTGVKRLSKSHQLLESGSINAAYKFQGWLELEGFPWFLETLPSIPASPFYSSSASNKATVTRRAWICTRRRHKPSMHATQHTARSTHVKTPIGVTLRWSPVSSAKPGSLPTEIYSRASKARSLNTLLVAPTSTWDKNSNTTKRG